MGGNERKRQQRTRKTKSIKQTNKQTNIIIEKKR